MVYCVGERVRGARQTDGEVVMMGAAAAMRGAAERSKPPLHNFNLPCSWGNQRKLKCKLPADSVHGGAADRGRRNNRSPTRSYEEEGIEEVREKIMMDFKTAADRLRHELFKKSSHHHHHHHQKQQQQQQRWVSPRREADDDDEDDDDDDDDEEEEEGELSRSKSRSRSRSPPRRAPPAEKEKEKEEEVKPWNLRTRRAACKAPAPGIGGKAMTVAAAASNSNSSPGKSESAKSPRLLRGVGEKREREEKEKEKERAKFSLGLSKKEIEEDFMEMVCHRPARRPKKRPRAVQRQIDMLFPGMWLTEVTADMYTVPEVADTGKSLLPSVFFFSEIAEQMVAIIEVPEFRSLCLLTTITLVNIQEVYQSST
ncbi:hypothetical protein Tsubulata_039851 [Turnera subulata]|uniref:DUF1639 domain-containing protein n=1 Tax=Turnera subulata TaxID=218843 RepID=A0A9Q0FCP2_9ROSI|nr:hypothetical protein Tsubulata_039851 [Turnera subulata]